MNWSWLGWILLNGLQTLGTQFVKAKKKGRKKRNPTFPQCIAKICLDWFLRTHYFVSPFLLSSCIENWMFRYTPVTYICIWDCYECMCACCTLSGAEGSWGLVVRYTLGLNSFRVVVIYHLVRNFCQNALSQSRRRGLKNRKRRQKGDISETYIHTDKHICTSKHKHTKKHVLSTSRSWEKNVSSTVRCSQRLMWSDKIVWQPLKYSCFPFFVFKCHHLIFVHNKWAVKRPSKKK